MNHLTTMCCCNVIFVLACAGCSQPRNQANAAMDETDARTVEPMDDQFETAPPRDTVSKVMQAKLAHAQAVLEGLALADYAQIQSNALALKRRASASDRPAIFMSHSGFLDIRPLSMATASVVRI